MISIIISTYQRPEKLKRAIQSVIDQTYRDWELIVVCDGKKEVKDIDLSWYKAQDKNPITVYSIDHFGSDTKPKNYGILQSKGEYIAFLDDDNEYLPDHLMILAKGAKDFPDTDVIYGDRLIVFDDEEKDPQVGVASDYNPGLLFQQNYIDTSDVLVKREALFLVGGFDERYAKYVDWNLWVRMTKAQLKFQHIAKIITNYHIHSEMKSLTVKDKFPVGEKPFGSINPQRLFKPQWDGFEVEIQLPYLGDLTPPKVAIFSCLMNRLDYSKKMFESFKKAGYPLTWFAIDNGSTDGTVEWLQTLHETEDIRVRALFNKKNIGISRASNQAIEAMNGEYDFIIKIDNDCEVLTEKWLDKLLHIFAAHWQIILSPYVEGLVDNPGGAPRLAYKNLRGHLLGMTPMIGGIFTMTHKNAFRKFRWSEKDFLHTFTDLIFCEAMKKEGYLTGYVEDMRVMHIDGTQGQKEKYPDYFKKRIYERTHTE